MSSRLFPLLLLGVLMTACGNSPSKTSAQNPPVRSSTLASQSLTAASGSTLHTFQASLQASTRLSVPGLPEQTVQTPPGLQVAYLFNGDEVKTRLDMPGAGFTDGRARIALYDTATNAARVVFADTFTPDSSMDTDQLVALLEPQTKLGTESMAKSYQAQSAASFKANMTAENVPTNEATITQNGQVRSVIQANQTFSNPNGGDQQTQITFDPQVGTVTQVQSRLNTPEGLQSTTANYIYDTVANLPDVRIPTHVHTDGQLTATQTGQNIQLTQDVDY